MDEAVAQAPDRESSLSARRALLDDWVAGERAVARVQANQVVLLAARLDLLAEEPDFDRGGDVSLRSLAAEYAAAAHIPPSTAAVRLTDAWAMVHQFPGVLESLRAGRITRQHADVIMNEAPVLPGADAAEREQVRDEYTARVLEFAEQDTAARTRAHARGVATALTPEDTMAAHKKAHARRRVTVTPDGDGMAVLTALLPELLAYAIKDRLTAQAKALKKLNEEHDQNITPPAEPADDLEVPDDDYDAFLTRLAEEAAAEKGSDGEQASGRGTESADPSVDESGPAGESRPAGPSGGFWGSGADAEDPAPWDADSDADTDAQPDDDAQSDDGARSDDDARSDDEARLDDDVFIDLADLSPFSDAAEAFTDFDFDFDFDTTPSTASDADAAAAAAVDAEFDAIIADLIANGMPEDPLPPDPTRRYVFSHEPPEDPVGVRLDDERTMDQLRADLLSDLLLTGAPTSTIAGSGAGPGTGSASGDGATTALGAIRATVQVTLRASTLAGRDDLPAELDGTGPLDPDWARALAAEAPSLDRLFLDARGMVTATDSYTPTANMKRFLRARDQHCRFPGCRRPPHHCQIDHNHDHGKGGPTALCNLCLFCTGHHPIKHPDLYDDDRWTATQLSGGIIVWTSPLGRTYTDHPAARVIFA